MSILFAILIFEAIIIIHELGHFIAAKASGVKVNEFAIGMGPAILKKKKEMENMTFLINNIGTILTGAVLLIIVALVLRIMIRDKKTGKGGCGGSCGGCSNACACQGSVKSGKAK